MQALGWDGELCGTQFCGAVEYPPTPLRKNSCVTKQELFADVLAQ